MFPPRSTNPLATVLACIAFALLAPWAHAQAPATSAEPIYWRQNLFLIPYQWNAANGAGTSQSIVLYVSKDRGTTWQSVSEAQPSVRAFNYHAEADGEYWFAIRTLDGHGNALPLGPIQPELRVIVDTTIPRFEQLAGVQRDDGLLEVRWRAVDLNYDSQTCNIEAQIDRDGNWQPVTAPANASPITGTTWEAVATMQVPEGSRVTAVRVTAFDRARNRAVYQSSVAGSSAAPAPPAGAAFPAIVDARGGAATPADSSASPPAWFANSTLSTAPSVTGPELPSQPWPVDRAADALVGATPAYVPPPSIAPPAPLAVEIADAVDQFTSAGDAAAVAESSTEGREAGLANRNAPSPYPLPKGEGFEPPIADDRPLGDVPAQLERQYAPLEPFREASMSRVADSNGAITPIAGTPPRNRGFTWLGPESELLPADAVPKLVNSRAFALDYVLEQVGHEGIARVELWGSRDGGKTWRLFGVDDDNRSPMVTTVDGEGLYGFRMVVESATGRGGFPPQPGDRPELWIGVDMHRPDVTLTSADPGVGDDAGSLVLEWDADDDNLQSRPISLYYSSRPTGPWTTIATNLANSRHYAWRLERFVPPRVYLRLEARDTAGNLAAFQTSEPIIVEIPESVARVSTIEAVQAPPTVWPAAPAVE